MLLYAWVAHDNFLPAFGQLRLLRESIHQIDVFIQQTRRSTPNATGMIVALHANKPHGRGNIYDQQQSPTSRFLNACRRRLLSPSAQMLVVEAMPLQQFPDSCGCFEGIKGPPFPHPPVYPPQAWALGRLFLHIQLIVVRNSLGRPAADYFKGMLICGRWACARFGLTSGQMSQAPPAVMEPLLQDTARPLPCASTFHPSAIEWRGLQIAQDFESAFAQVAAVVSGKATSMTLGPAFTATSIQQLLKRLSGTLSRLLQGDISSATIINSQYLGLSAIALPFSSHTHDIHLNLSLPMLHP